MRNLLKKFNDYRSFQKSYKRTFNELNALTHRELLDIGIDSGNIRQLCLEQARLDMKKKI